MQDEKPDTRPREFSLAARWRSFRHAGNGLRYLLRSEPNARLHCVAAMLVVASGWWVGLSAADWRWITIAIAMVLFAEAMNTALELVCDVVSPGYHAQVGKAKDIAAGAVSISAGAAAVIGCLTFWRYVFP
jgi:diacylglycerol kinase (ATP)